MVESFRELGTVEGKQRYRVITKMGGSYGYGVVRGLDGVARWGIDFDEFVHYSR